MQYPYYKLDNGELISKERVDNAIELLNRIKDANGIVNLTEEELFSKGDKIQAVRVFREKHGCTLMEAKVAIEHLRGETII